MLGFPVLAPFCPKLLRCVACGCPRTVAFMVTGDELRRARNRAKLTQGELAKRLGVSLRTVGNWESGQPIAPFNLAAIEDFVAEAGLPAGLSGPDCSIAWPEGTFDGLDCVEVDEVLTAARLAGLCRARVIRLTPNRGSAPEGGAA